MIHKLCKDSRHNNDFTLVLFTLNTDSRIKALFTCELITFEVPSAKVSILP